MQLEENQTPRKTMNTEKQDDEAQDMPTTPENQEEASQSRRRKRIKFVRSGVLRPINLTDRYDDTSKSDMSLQPTKKRRKFLRRGSKCPSMIFGLADLQVFQLDLPSEEGAEEIRDPTVSSSSPQHKGNSEEVVDEVEHLGETFTALKTSSFSDSTP